MWQLIAYLFLSLSLFEEQKKTSKKSLRPKIIHIVLLVKVELCISMEIGANLQPIHKRLKFEESD